jgi:hypothetical protein
VIDLSLRGLCGGRASGRLLRCLDVVQHSPMHGVSEETHQRGDQRNLLPPTVRLSYERRLKVRSLPLADQEKRPAGRLSCIAGQSGLGDAEQHRPMPLYSTEPSKKKAREQGAAGQSTFLKRSTARNGATPIRVDADQPTLRNAQKLVCRSALS